jgi:hypothetical protein
MKKTLLAGAACLAITSSAFAQVTNAFDFGGNYGSGWTNGANGGFGFGAWNFTINQGTGASGTFIGDPAGAGISGMPTNSFGLYANAQGSGATVTAARALSSALAVGETFSLQWGINFDGDNGINGNKGFNLFIGTNNVVNVNNGGNADIQFNSINTGMGYGTTAMTWTFVYTNATTLVVSANDRDGSGTFSTNLTVGGGIDSLSFYATELGAGDQRQPYYNDLAVVVPEPSTYALLALSALGLAGYAARRRARR